MSESPFTHWPMMIEEYSVLLCMVDGPAKGREVTSSGPFYNIVFAEMGECCGNPMHWKMRDCRYNAEGHFIDYGEWEHYQNRIDDFPLRLEVPHE